MRVILGIGNVLRGDDGIGIHALHAIAQSPNLPSDVRCVEAGTNLLCALPYIERAEKILILDAGEAGRQPGEIFTFSTPLLSALQPVPMRGLHAFSIIEAIALIPKRLRPNCDELHWLCMQPESLELGLDLSEVAKSQLSRMVAAIFDFIAPR